MTFKIKMLAAAAVLAVPGLASAQLLDATGQGQVETPPIPPVDNPVIPPVDSLVTPPVTDPIQDTVRDTVPPGPETVPPVETPPVDTEAEAQAEVQVEPGTVSAATAADVQAGATVRDQSGAPVGTIESVEGQAAVVNTGTVRAEIPISSFGKDTQGLVLAMTRAQLEAAAGARTPS